MDHAAIGSQLRSRRAATGRTVASVAADAGLSVPYIANLENGRGNPTITALARLAEALGMRLAVTLVPAGQQSGVPATASASAAAAAEVPASLVRFGRSARFRQSVRVIATALDLEAGELSGRLVTALAALGNALGRDLSEADWSRLLDAFLLVAAHPADA